ncbi:hypothetical protein ABZ858_28675 [Streptomyces sp. NPDC047017]|uniref:hypothetical protein n=1 Tax=Streptomyces sp. NPDC047017 TaxID=3155024 RepID=UPI0033DBE043
MRPATFQAFLLDTFKNAPGVTRVQTLAEAGDTKHPYGVAVVTSDGESRWQIIGQLAEGERHEHKEQPVQGAPGTWTGPDSGPIGFLGAALGRAECPEIAQLASYKDPSAGLTVTFHNGARAFVRLI